MYEHFYRQLGVHRNGPGFASSSELYGAVDTITVITDPETGHPCGFGFVEMPERGAARAAIAGLHGTDLSGHACTVNEAYGWVHDQGELTVSPGA